MTSEEFKKKINMVLNDAVSLQVYFVLKTQNGKTIKLADIDNGKTLQDLKALFIDKINEDLINDEQLSILELSTTDERTNAIYHYDLDDLPEELIPIYNFNLKNKFETFSFQFDNLKDINGFIILVGSRNNNMVLYKKHYPVCLIRRDSFMLIKKDERFIKMEEDILKLSSNFDFLKIGNDLFIKELSVLENFFGFREIIKKEALLALSQIDAKGIVEDIEVLKETVDDVTFARKLTKVRKDSPVLTMDIPIEQIISFTRTTPALAGRFKYSSDGKKIRLDTKKSKEAFVKLLNDDFLKSELTQLYYDSLAKDKIPVTV